MRRKTPYPGYTVAPVSAVPPGNSRMWFRCVGFPLILTLSFLEEGPIEPGFLLLPEGEGRDEGIRLHSFNPFPLQQLSHP